jgi:hypothetical protein
MLAFVHMTHGLQQMLHCLTQLRSGAVEVVVALPWLAGASQLEAACHACLQMLGQSWYSQLLCCKLAGAALSAVFHCPQQHQLQHHICACKHHQVELALTAENTSGQRTQAMYCWLKLLAWAAKARYMLVNETSRLFRVIGSNVPAAICLGQYERLENAEFDY